MNNYPVIQAVKERWSPYSFSPEPVEEEKLISIFEAARHAPSSMNEQPWLFVFTTKDYSEIFENFLNFLYEGNKIWAINAHILAVIMSRTRFLRDNKPNRHAFYDTGMAVANLLVQATSLGIYVHQMGGFSVKAVKEYFETNDLVEPVAMMAIGYLGNGSGLNAELRRRDSDRRPRKHLSEFVFRNDMKTPAFR